MPLDAQGREPNGRNGRNGRKSEKGVGIVGVLAGVVGLAALGVGGWFAWDKWFKPKTGELDEPEERDEPKPDEDPDEPEEADEPKPEPEEADEPKPAPAPAPAGTTTVPAMTETPYNEAKFSSPEIVSGILAGLGPGQRYHMAFKQQTSLFQKDWNTLAKAGKLKPSSLNSSRLKTDAVMGVQTLRALEWADDGNFGWDPANA